MSSSVYRNPSRPGGDPRAGAQRAAAREPRPGSSGKGKLAAAGFWGTLAALVLSVATVPGLVIVAFLPLAGLGYLLFCLIATATDRDVE